MLLLKGAAFWQRLLAKRGCLESLRIVDFSYSDKHCTTQTIELVDEIMLAPILHLDLQSNYWSAP